MPRHCSRSEPINGPLPYRHDNGTIHGAAQVRALQRHAVRRPLALYVHLPFCVRKCRYCDFNSGPAAEPLRAEYLTALRRELSVRARDLSASARVDTIFFGGGTPTIYPAGDLARLLGLVTDLFRVSPAAEISIEANPETLTPGKLRRLRSGGFNRLSIGAQSFDDRELAMLGRGHCAADTVRASSWARQAGFDDLSLDLIYALPGQRLADWQRTLDRALRLGPDHLSAYGLSIEEGTPLAADVAAGRLSPVSEDQHLAMREATGAACASVGMRRYEISNYALAGRTCRHNMVYWRNGEYLGVGAGAVSYLDGARVRNEPDPTHYTELALAGEDLASFSERMDPAGTLAETVMLGLRLTDGLELATLEGRFGADAVREMLARARMLIDAGLLREGRGRLRLTAAGQPLHGEVAARLI